MSAKTPSIRISCLIASVLTSACADLPQREDAPPGPIPGMRVLGALSPATEESPLSCNFTANVATVAVGAARARVSRGLTDGVLYVNGQACTNGSGTQVTVTRGAALAKRLVLQVEPGATVVLDFGNGTFLPGTSATVAGIEVVAPEGSEGSGWSLGVLGSKAADNMTAGVKGLSFDRNANLDVKWSRAPIALEIAGAAGNDDVSGGGDVPRRIRGTGTAYEGEMHVLGGDGNDALAGGDGDDRLEGGPGNDKFPVLPAANAEARADGADTFIGGTGLDVVDYSQRGEAVLVTTGAAWVPLEVDGVRDAETCEPPVTPGGAWTPKETSPPEGFNRTGRDRDGRITFSECVTDCDPFEDIWVSEGDTVADDVERVTGTKFGDWLFGGCGKDAFFAGLGDDFLDGGGGDDDLRGERGDDTFDAGGAPDGKDTFTGGPGVDTVDYGRRVAALVVTMEGRANDGANAGAEADNVQRDVERLRGGAGADTLTGSASANVLSGGEGDDTLRGGNGNDVLVGQDGNDKLYGGNGHDTLRGGLGDDQLFGENGNDRLEGERGRWCGADETIACGADDTCANGDACYFEEDCGEGNTCNDSLDGGNGNDTITQRDDPGADTITCAAGADTLSYLGRLGGVSVTKDNVANDGETGTDSIDRNPTSGLRDNVSSTCETVQLPPTPVPEKSVITVSKTGVALGEEVTVTLTLADGSGAPLLQRGATVVFALQAGGVGALQDGGETLEGDDGTYSVIFKADAAGTAVVRATVNGVAVEAPSPTITVGGSGPASCEDGVRNGDETDVDCGGTGCPRCDQGAQCESASDCLSFSCQGTCSVDFVSVAAGTFWVGSPAEERGRDEFNEAQG
jgi:Ca2+-binding RTX toxin-like protein